MGFVSIKPGSADISKLTEREDKPFSHPNPNDCQHIAFTYISHFYSDSDLKEPTALLRTYEQYAPEILDRVMFVIVDDGSEIEYEVPKFNLNLRWIKIKENIFNNIAGARNLGVTYAKSDNIHITDIDKVMTEETMRYLIGRGPCGNKFYRYYRIADPARLSGRIVKQNIFEKLLGIGKGQLITSPHSNTFFVSRAEYMRNFGYEEEFSGDFGYDDLWFSKRQRYFGNVQLKFSKKYLLYELKEEYGYTHKNRHLEYNDAIYQRKRDEMRKYGANGGHSRIFLDFHWDILSEQRRPNRPTPPQNKIWFKVWNLRCLWNLLLFRF